MIIIGAIVLIIGVLFWIWAAIASGKLVDKYTHEAFIRMLEAENSTWKKYEYTETTITSGSPVIKE